MIRAIGAEKIDVKKIVFFKKSWNFEKKMSKILIFFGKFVYSPSMGLMLLDSTVMESQRANLSFFAKSEHSMHF